MRKKPALLATLAVLVLGATGATSVFLVGSKQRRDDRSAYLAYERAVLGPLSDGGRIVEQEMKPSLAELRTGSITPAEALSRTAAWGRAFAAVRSEVVALDPPAFLGDIERRWTAAIDLYARIPTIAAEAARASGASRGLFLDAAQSAGERADDLFDRAAAVMQFHRRRLGLGPTAGLPDPAATGRS